MKDTIKAKNYYRIMKSDRLEKENGTNARFLLDGDKIVMVCYIMSQEEADFNLANNEMFIKHEVFTTRKGSQFIYYRDEEIDVDYIVKVGA